MKSGWNIARSFISLGVEKIHSFLFPYRQPSLQNHWKRYVRDGVAASLFIGALILFFTASAATYDFTQTSWGGGADPVSVATHASNQTNWTKYTTGTGLVIGGTVQLIPSTFTFTDDGATSTSPGATAFGGGFGAGTLSQTAIRGSGTGASVGLGKINAATPSLSTGEYFVHALKSDGTLWAWGQNGYGQLGDGSITARSVPVQVSNLTGVTLIGAGPSSGYALKSDGTLWAWGQNNYGQLGNDSTTESHVPVQVSNLTGVVATMGASYTAYAVKSDGTAWSWGTNGSGQLGNNSIIDSRIPVQVSNLTGTIAVDGGNSVGYALKSDGTVWSWGYNGYGQLGNNSTTPSSVPVQVSNLTGVTAIAAGNYFAYALKSDGTVWSWGYNGNGQLGTNSGAEIHVPVQVSNLTGITAITAGYGFGSALKSDGTVWTWGDNSWGQLGDGSLSSRYLPVKVSNLTGVIAITNGNYSAHALKSDGTVWGWGYNALGQLGNNSTTDSRTPVQASVNLGTDAYASSGTFTSAVINVASGAIFGAVNWTFTLNGLPASSIAMKVRSSATADFSSAPAWGTCSSVTAGSNMSTGGCVTNGHQYVQYQVSLSTTDSSITPTVDSVSFAYTQYNVTGSLISSVYDTGSSANLVTAVRWLANGTSSTETVKFQLRSASTTALLASAPWCGPDIACDGTTYFTDSSGLGVLPSNHPLRIGEDDQYFQYKAVLSSGGGSTPLLSSVTVMYVVNATPAFDTSFGTNGVLSTLIATSTDPNFGKAYVVYKIKDQDTTAGSVTPGFVTPSFEYDIGSGWIPIPAQYLSAGATDNKNVSEGSYTTYEAYVDLRTLIPNTYYAAARIRVKINDNEGANNIAYAVASPFILDTKAPAISSIHIDGTSSTSTFSFAATDDLSIQEYIVSNRDDFTADGSNGTSGIAQQVNNSSAAVAIPWTLPTGSSTKTVYLKLMDERGNVVTRSVVVPATPSNVEYKDLSNIDNGTYREFIAWNLYPDPVPEGAPFGSYQLYKSPDGTNFSLLYTSTNPTINYFLDIPVSTSTLYYYKVAFVTANGDRSAFSPTVSDTADGKGGSNNGAIPLISNVQVTDIKNTSAKVTWTTDDLALSEVDYGPTTSYGQVKQNRSYVTDHVVYLTGLMPNTSYVARVRSIDAFSGTATNDNGGNGYAFTTGGGPVISSVSMPAVSATGADIAWKTNVAADSHIDYSTSPILTTHLSSGTDDLVASPFQHLVSLSSLVADTYYYYRISSKDAEGNITVDDNNGSYYSFRTTNDTKAPVISSVAVPVKASDSAVVTWTTDELSTSKVEYGTISGTSSSYLSSSVEITTPSIFHSVTLSGETVKQGGGTNALTKKTTYYYRVKSSDQAGNTSYSDEGTFTTTEDGAVVLLGGGYSANNDTKSDTVKPTVSDLKISAVGPFGATVEFTTNKETRDVIQYGETVDYSGSSGDVAFATSHKWVLKGLKMGMTYHVSASVVDRSGNVSTSPDETFKTTNLAEDLGALSTLSEGLDGIQEKIENLIESALPSINPPFIEKPTVEDIGEDFARITWRTNVKAYGSVVYTEDSMFGASNEYAWEQSKTDEKTVDHAIELPNLKSNTKYHFKVKSHVFPGSVGESTDMTFITKAGQIKAQIKDRKKDSMRVVWDTNLPTTSVVTYKIRGSQSATKKSEDGLTTSHEIRLENLLPATTYEIRAYGLTSDGNMVEARDTIIASTNEDTAAPVITNFKVDTALVPGRNDRTQTIVSWKTDEPSTSVVYYDEGPGMASSSLSQVKDTGQMYTDTHVVILTNLKPGTIYRFQIVSADDANNTAKLPVRTIVTPSQSESIVDVIFKNFDDTFKFMKSVR